MTDAIGLIPCSTCGHQIGTQADICPQCGSPNTWMHPTIKAMYEKKVFDTTRGFNFWHKGSEVWGESIYHSFLCYVGALVIVLISLLSAFISLFIGPVIGGLVLAFFWRGTSKRDTFRANLVTGSWESSNDAFWKPVADFLRLPVSS